MRYFFRVRKSLVSRNSTVDGDWLPATESCQRYLPCCQAASDIAENLGKFICTKCTGQRNDFELIPTVKMKTRNPVGGYFGSKIRSVICNHCGLMAA